MTGPKLNPSLQNTPIYVAGKSIDVIREKYGLDKIVKLASNESPIGPSPVAIQAAMEMMEQAHRYPGLADLNLRQKLAQRISPGLGEDNFVIGNGATDVIRMVAQAFTFDGGNNIMGEAPFPMYHIFTTMFGGVSKVVSLDAKYQFDFDAMLGQIDDDTRILFLCSPNNPTGKIITQSDLARVMRDVPDHVVVLMDESYYEYITDAERPDSLSYVKEDRNVVVLRSFSKRSGLANLRIGYMIAPARLANYVRHALLPFNTSDIALAAASASLDDAAYNDLQRKTVLEGREYFQTAFADLDLNIIPSQANFVAFVDPPLGAARLSELLLRRGFIVRELSTFGMKNAIRVSVGSSEDNEAFVKTLKHVLETEGAAA